MNVMKERWIPIVKGWKAIGMGQATSVAERLRDTWTHSVTEGHDLWHEMREVNWAREAIHLFDRLSNATHLYLTSSLVLGSFVMWYAGVPAGVFVVALMTFPLIMLKLILRIANYLEYDKACEAHFTALMDACLRHWEQSGSFRQHLEQQLAMMDEAHEEMSNSEPRMQRAYRAYFDNHQKRINAHFLMVFGFPVSANDLQGATCAVSRMLTNSARMRHEWETEYGPYLKDKPLRMEQLLWLMHRLPVVYDLR